MEICTDNRFELIEKYKKALLESTNIADSEEEMNVIDNVLFRFWQIGWLDGLENVNRQKAEIDDLKRDTIPKLRWGLSRANKMGMDLEKENEQLKAEVERLQWGECRYIGKTIVNARKEAIEDFENLIINNLIERTYSRDCLLCLIKEWAKELTEEKK